LDPPVGGFSHDGMDTLEYASTGQGHARHTLAGRYTIRSQPVRPTSCAFRRCP
jgi:hypothetical protein